MIAELYRISTQQILIDSHLVLEDYALYVLGSQ